MKKKALIEGNIEIAFSRLIGSMAIMNVLDSYKESHNEIKKIFDIIVKWAAKFQINRDLSFIDSKELLDIYYRVDKLKDKYLFDKNLGLESELSDEIVIWMDELIQLRKELIERSE